MVARSPRSVERMVHQPRKQLHGHILEGERCAVEQFEDEGIGPLWTSGRHGRMLEGRIGRVDHRLEIGSAMSSHRQRASSIGQRDLLV